MTPKEKAKELVDKMWNINERYGSIGFHEAKQCALVVVDEVIAEYGTFFQRIHYWQEVKQEIENL